MGPVSARIAAFVDALPLKKGLRVLELGCGPGVAARLVWERVGPTGFVLGVDRSAKAIALATAAGGGPDYLCAAAEDLDVSGWPRFDLAFALRVGAFDGRHPELEARALTRVAAALKPRGRFFIDSGEVSLHRAAR